MSLSELLRDPETIRHWNGGEIAISSRIRLARNLAGHSFPDWAGETECAQVWERLRAVWPECPALKPYRMAANDELTPLDRQVLVERHLASRELSRKGRGSGIVVREDLRVSVMVNEEDHLRIQILGLGLCLDDLWRKMEELDRQIEEHVPMAYCGRLGYLTACPTNVGTGLRASVMLHLPGLALTNDLPGVLRAVAKLGLTARGFWGEGTEAVGHFYQISNQITLGDTEHRLIASLDSVVREVMDHERNARQRLLENRPAVLYDHVGRAYGILSHAHLLATHEAIALLSALRLGVVMGMVSSVDRAMLDAMLIAVQPGHIQMLSERALDAHERDEWRARLVREWLSPPRRRSPRKKKNG
jgi:protein arginine kinase